MVFNFLVGYDVIVRTTREHMIEHISRNAYGEGKQNKAEQRTE